MRPLHALLLLALASCLSAPQPAPTAMDKPASAVQPPPGFETKAGPSAQEEPVPTLQLPKDVRPTRYALSLVIDPDRDTFQGTADVSLQLDKPRSVIFLHGRELEMSKVSVEAQGKRKDARYEQVDPDGVARIALPAAIGPGQATLHFEWTARFDKELVGLYRAHEAGVQYAVTQFEAIDARRAFPCFDEPIFKTPFDVTLTVPEADVAISNTSPVEETKVEGGMKRTRFATTRPLPTYLVVFAAGPFDVVAPPPLPPNEVRKRPLQVRGIAPKGRGAELAFALEVGGKLLEAEERYFGLEYPYDKLDHIAVPDFSAGAMENAGGITYRESALLYKEGTSSATARVGIAGTMAHEMAHQWFGDLVTLPWWTDAWLNESFATWMATKAMVVAQPEANHDVLLLQGVQGAMGTDALLSARRIRQPLDRIGDIWNQFDGLTYQKGAGVLGMFERWATPPRFQKGIHDYIAAHADGTGDTGALLASLSAAAGKEVGAPFRTFLEQAGVPLVAAGLSCDASGARLVLAQRRFFPLGSEGKPGQLWQVPVCARYATAGEEHESCTLLSAEHGVLPLEGKGCPDWLIPNANAAGYYRWSLDPAALGKLAKAGYGKLDVRERLSFASSVNAALGAGAIEEPDALAQLQAFARDPSGYVAPAPMTLIRTARDYLVEPEHQPLVEAYARELYAGQAKRLGWKGAKGESDETRRFRVVLLGFMAETARDPAIRKEAARLGRAYVAGGKVHPEAVDPSLSGLALSVAVRDGDEKLFDAVLGLLAAAEDSGVRGRILGALTSTRDPKLVRRALQLSFDPRLRENERLSVVLGFSREPETREAAWKWMQESYDQLIAALPRQYRSRLLFVPAGFCDAQHLAGSHAFFAQRATKVPGGERLLAEAEEEARLCIAQRAAHAAGAEAFFAARKRDGHAAGASR